MARVILATATGEQRLVDSVMLFPEDEAGRVLALKTQVQEELGGFSTGIGFWGSRVKDLHQIQRRGSDREK